MARVYFLMFAAFGALSPYLAPYLSDQGHLSSPQIAAILAVQPMVALAAQPMWGLIVDAREKKHRALAALMFALAAMVLLLRVLHGFLPIFLGFIAYALFATALSPVADSLALAEVATKGGDYPKMRLWGSLGFMVVSMASGWVFDRTGLGLSLPLFAALMALAGLYIWFRPVGGGAQNRRNSLWSGLKGLLSQRLLWVVLALSFVNQVAYAAHSSFFSLYLKGLGASQGMVGLAWAIAAATEVPVFFWLGGWMRRAGKEPLLVLSGLVWALRFFLYAHLQQVGLAVAVSLLQGVSFGVFYATAVVLVGEITPPEVRTTGQALLAVVNSGAAAIAGSLLGGQLARLYGLPGMYAVVQWLALASATGFAVVWLLRRREVA